MLNHKKIAFLSQILIHTEVNFMEIFKGTISIGADDSFGCSFPAHR